MGCAARVVAWAKEQEHDKNDLIWIFEKGDRDQNDLRRHWDIAYPDGAVEPIFLRKKDIYEKREERSIRPFEAADLIGYENLHTYRLLRSKGGTQIFSDLRKPMRRLLKLKGANLWGYLSEEEILLTCSEWNILPR
jgi:hypothetical protein